jgi:hypothetical protein
LKRGPDATQATETEEGKNVRDYPGSNGGGWIFFFSDAADSPTINEPCT